MIYFFITIFLLLFLQRIFGTIGLWYKRKYLQNLDQHESFFTFFIQKAFSPIITEPGLWIKPLEKVDNCHDFYIFQKANIYAYTSNISTFLMVICAIVMVAFDIYF